jgi:hypothetical protein
MALFSAASFGDKAAVSFAGTAAFLFNRKPSRKGQMQRKEAVQLAFLMFSFELQFDVYSQEVVMKKETGIWLSRGV